MEKTNITKELKNGEWVEATPIKYERFAFIKDTFTFVKRLCKTTFKWKN